MNYLMESAQKTDRAIQGHNGDQKGEHLSRKERQGELGLFSVEKALERPYCDLSIPQSGLQERWG